MSISWHCDGSVWWLFGQAAFFDVGQDKEEVMRGFKKISLIYLIIAVIVSAALIIIDEKCCIAASEQESNVSGVQLNKGSIAPDFTIENMLKKNVALKDYRGSILVLAFGFAMDPAKDIEKYRSRIRSDFKGKGVSFLKVIHINIPSFGKWFVVKMIKKNFPDEETINHTVIDWGGSLSLDEKYGIKDKEPPTLFIIGREGRILFALQGLFSEDNLKKIEKELSNILSVGENAYLGISSAAKEKKVLVGVTRIVTNRFLDLKQEGFKAALEEAGYVEGKNIKFDIQDTESNPEKIVQTANKFMNDKVDLIHCLSITGTIIMTETVKKIPVVGYASYKGDPSKMGYAGSNITGVIVKGCVLQDLWPVRAQLEMYVKFVPDAKRWGTVYNSGSANSRFHIKEIRDVSKELGVELVEAPISKPAEIRKATQSLVGKVDAFYITSDKMAMSAFEDIAEVCNKNRIPLFSGDFEGVSKGAIAAYNMNYFLVGYKAGKLGARILKGEKLKDITPEFIKKLELLISLTNASQQGLIIPEELKKRADKIL